MGMKREESAAMEAERAFGRTGVRADTFRHAIGHFPTGVCVVTTSVSGDGFGATVSSLASLSLDPPMLLICLKHSSNTLRAIKRRGAFVVNLLAEDQASVAAHFATDDGAKIAVDPQSDALPVLADTLGFIECDVESMVRGGSHLVITAIVQKVAMAQGHPLTYYRGRFGGFLPALTLLKPPD